MLGYGRACGVPERSCDPCIRPSVWWSRNRFRMAMASSDCARTPRGEREAHQAWLSACSHRSDYRKRCWGAKGDCARSSEQIEGWLSWWPVDQLDMSADGSATLECIPCRMRARMRSLEGALEVEILLTTDVKKNAKNVYLRAPMSRLDRSAPRRLRLWRTMRIIFARC